MYRYSFTILAVTLLCVTSAQAGYAQRAKPCLRAARVAAPLKTLALPALSRKALALPALSRVPAPFPSAARALSLINHPDPFDILAARSLASRHDRLIRRKLAKLQRAFELLRERKARTPERTRFVVESFTRPDGTRSSIYQYKDSEGRFLTDGGRATPERSTEHAARPDHSAKRTRTSPTASGGAKRPRDVHIHPVRDVVVPAAASTATAGAVGYLAQQHLQQQQQQQQQQEQQSVVDDNAINGDITAKVDVLDDTASADTDAAGAAPHDDLDGGLRGADGEDLGRNDGLEFEFETLDDDPGDTSFDGPMDDWEDVEVGDADEDFSVMDMSEEELSDTSYSPWSDDDEDEDEDSLADDGEAPDGYFNTRGDFVLY